MTTGADARAATPVTAPTPTGEAQAAASPFTMLPGATGAMVCEGDVCYVPGLADAASTE